MKNSDYVLRLKAPSCPPLGDDRLRSSACGLSGVSQAYKTNSYSSFFIHHSSFNELFTKEKVTPILHLKHPIMPYNAKERVSLHNNWRLTLDMIIY